MVEITPAATVTLTWEWVEGAGWPTRVTGDLPPSDRPRRPDMNRARTVEPERLSVTIEGPSADGYTLATVTVSGARVLTNGRVSWTSTTVQWTGNPYVTPADWCPGWLSVYINAAIRAAGWHERDVEWIPGGFQDA